MEMIFENEVEQTMEVDDHGDEDVDVSDRLVP
jgi:hypothetical protein